MSRRLNILTMLAFCAFLALPLGLLLVFGAVEPYGQKDFTPFPGPQKLLHASPSARSELSTALFERSPATVFAIRTHNAALYRVTGTIDNNEMISGADGWLFYKQEFWDGKCIPDETTSSMLRTIDTMQAMAAASGLPVLFSVSPDKITIHPEKLGTRARVFAGCRLQDGRRWREMAKRLAPDLLDHAVGLLNPENPKGPYYFATDTHWNTRGVALAVSQLVSKIDGTPPQVPTLFAGTRYVKYTDMRNRMLLLDGPEPDQKVLVFRSPRQDVTPLLFISDSFYQHAREQLEYAFPNSKFYNIETENDEYAEALQDHNGQVVVNTVERLLYLRFKDWNSALAHAILKRNMTLAEKCAYTQPIDIAAEATLDNIERTGPSSYLAKTDNADLIVPIPEKVDCVRITLEVPSPLEYEMYLPPLDGRDDPEPFAEGRSVVLDLPAGKSVLTFMLPNGRAGSELRIDPVNAPVPFKLSEVTFGTFTEP